MRRRVVVTGMGVVSPLGNSPAALRDALLAGRSGVAPITLFDPATLPTRIAAQVRVDWDGAAEMGALPVPGATFRDRKIVFAIEAARQAMAAAGVCGTAPGGREGGRGGGASVGIGLELFSMEDLIALDRPGFVLPDSLRERMTFLQTPSDLCVHWISRRYGLDGPPLVHVSACAAGTDALGVAFRRVASGRRRWMLAGGTDSMINPLGVAGFCTLGATSTRNDRPGAASRPFDRGREGFVLGEGAGMVVLETLEDARARGATIHAEIAGYGCSFDAHGISEPHPEGRGAWQAMARALEDAGLKPEDVDAVNAHGTSTPKNDPVETLAIKRLLGERARRVPVSAPKSMMGHLISAAGAVEAIGAIACMEMDRVHPTINLDEPDPACDLDYVPHRSRPHEQRVVLSNSFGFGGQNASIVLRHARGLPC